MEKHIEIFKERLGDPISDENLRKYIIHCIQNNISTDVDFYTEYHHFFPRNKFPEFDKDESFKFKLSYDDHCLAHLLLAEAYPIRNFTRTLNFMPLSEAFAKRRNEAASLASKLAWEKLKADPIKYERWKTKKSAFMKIFRKSGSEMNLYISNKMIEFYASDRGIEYKKWQSNNFKEIWANLSKEEYNIRTANMKWKDKPNYEERSKAAFKRYEDEEFCNKFKETMTEVNKRQDKREIAGTKIKKLWETTEYREKTNSARNASHRKSNSEAFKEKWKDEEWKAKILADRKAKREALRPEKERILQEKKENKNIEKAKRKEEKKNLNIKEGNSLSLKEKWKDPIWREKMILARIEAKRRKINETN